LNEYDETVGNRWVAAISRQIDDGAIITTDVGQNQVWVAQSFQIKPNQTILFSSSHGAMGCSLPTAIGAYFASRKPIICFCGDGGFQMSIHELQFVAREKIPIKIILLNNRSLGMIRHFQELYFDSRYTMTMRGTGYTTPDFPAVANAFGIHSTSLSDVSAAKSVRRLLQSGTPELIEVVLPDETYVYPKLAAGRPVYDQDPSLDRQLTESIMRQGSVPK
jgi:acetolactate synthase-1/2/3 large subunit